MSKVLLAYGIKKISKEKQEKILAKLFSFSNSRDFKEEFWGSIRYKKFGNIQIIYSDINRRKIKFKINGDLLINICGQIFEEEEICKKFNSDCVENLLLDSFHDFNKLKEIIKRFSGTFVIFLYNKKTEKIIIFNDKFGLYPCYYSKEKKKFIFSSSAEAILATGEVSRKLNHSAIIDLLGIGTVQNNKSFALSVNRLAGAKYLKKTREGYKIDKYYQIEPKCGLSFKQKLELVNEKLVKAILKIYNIDNKNIFIGLTGGFDTRLMNAIALENGLKYTPYTLDRAGGEKLASKEIAIDLEIANKFAKKFLKGKNKLLKIKPGFFGTENRELVNIGGYWAEIASGSIMHSESYGGRVERLNFTKEYNKKNKIDPEKIYINNISSISYGATDNKELIHKANLSLTSFWKNYHGHMPLMTRRPEVFFSSIFNSYTPFVDDELLEAVYSVDFKYLNELYFYRKLIEKFYLKYYKDIPVFHGGNRSYYRYLKTKNPMISFYKKAIAEVFQADDGTYGPETKQLPKEEINKFNIYMESEVLTSWSEILLGRIRTVNNWCDHNL